MKLTGIHFLLTYQCTMECDHCFVWGSPWQEGVFTLRGIKSVLEQARELGTVKWIYFEGGEPFLYYPLLARGVKEASEMGFKVGIVSNAYWATTPEDAREWLLPLAGKVQELSVSSDLFHAGEKMSRLAQNAMAAAEELGISTGALQVAQPEDSQAALATEQLPLGESGVMYRGRAAKKLVDRAGRKPWQSLLECPYEDLRDPGRLHLDPLGNLHICQGIVIGNLFQTPLSEIIARYDPDQHPIIGPLLAGGPAELALRYGVEPEAVYADACHLCDQARRQLRALFPEVLLPDQMYGVVGDE